MKMIKISETSLDCLYEVSISSKGVRCTRSHILRYSGGKNCTLHLISISDWVHEDFHFLQYLL